ncbi:MAG: acyl--CoA ligase [Clostridiales bacterium]|nr:acyl--CoA ligase [Clostridiales bacterium]
MDYIGIIGRNSTEYVNILISIWKKKDCAVLVDYNTPYSTALQMLHEANVKICYIQSGIYTDMETKMQCSTDIKFKIFYVHYTGFVLLSKKCYDDFELSYSKNDAVILFSSGTTGTKKGVILSHYAINTNVDMIMDYMMIDNMDRMCIVKQFSHSSTLVGELLICLRAKMPVYITQDILIPRYTFHCIYANRVTRICLNPSLLLLYLRDNSINQYNLSSLKFLYISGDILNDQLLQDAIEKFSDAKICNMYGLTEAGPRVCINMNNKNILSNSVGKAIRNVEISIVNESGDNVKDGEKGRVLVRTPSRFSKYLGAQEYSNIPDCTWIDTGDIGYLDVDKNLYILGRSDSVILIDSHKIYLTELEKIICQVLKIEDCFLVDIKIKNKVQIGCLIVGNIIDYDRIKKILSETLCPWEIPAVFVLVQTIPKNSNGKRDKKFAQKIIYQNHKSTLIDI